MPFAFWKAMRNMCFSSFVLMGLMGSPHAVEGVGDDGGGGGVEV